MNRLTRTGARESTKWIGANEREATAEESLREDIVRICFGLHRRSSHRLGSVSRMLPCGPTGFARCPGGRLREI